MGARRPGPARLVTSWRRLERVIARHAYISDFFSLKDMKEAFHLQHMVSYMIIRTLGLKLIGF